MAAALPLVCPGAAVAQVTAYAFVPRASGPDRVTVIDTSTNAIVPTTISTLSSAVTAAASPDGRVVYLLSDQITVIDVATRTDIGTIAVGLAPYGVAFTPDGRKAYVTNGGSTSSVSIIDVTTNSVVGLPILFPNNSYLRNLAITPDGSMAYVSSESGVFPLNLADNSVGPVIPTGPANGIAILPDGLTALVAARDADAVRVVDLVLGTVSPTPIPVGQRPYGVTLSPDGTVAYVVNSSSPGTVSVINVATLGVVATIPVGIYPYNAAFTPDGRFAYVPNNDTNDVTVVDTATRTPYGQPIAVGPDPTGFGADFITPNIIVAAGGPLTIANDSGLDTASFRSFVPFHAGTLRLSGNWTTGRHLSILAGGGTIDTNGFDATVDGNVIGDGTLAKTGAGTLTLSETSTATHTGGTDVMSGTLTVNGTHSGPVTLYNGTTLRGSGSVGNLTVVDGNVSPGDSDGIDILHATQATLGLGDALVVNINGTVPGVGYDRLEVSGIASINNAQLVVQSSGSLPPGAQFTILNHAVGQFWHLPEGAVILAGNNFRISYVGGDVVLRHDAAPEITIPHPPSLNEDEGLVTIPFTVSDDVVDPLDVSVTVTSLNQALAPDANVSIVGTGASRAVALTTAPNASGLAGITLHVFDGANQVNISFSVVVNPVNDAPTISPVAPQSVPENMPLDPVAFTVGDIDNDVAGLTVTATSSNQAIVPDANLVIAGSGATRTIAAMPRVGVRGETTITLTVSDGSASTSTTFTLTVSERTYYLAEGATGAFFDTDILLANPNATAAPVRITFLKEDGTSIAQTRTLAATSQTTIRVDEIAGLEDTSFSTIVTSTDAMPIVVERSMRWDASGYGAHTEKATAGAASTWYFAEGAQGFFSTYFLLANPQATANTAHVTYFRENAPTIVRDYPLAAGSRTTIDAGTELELRNQAFGARVTFDLPGVAERSMYFGTSPLWVGGDVSAGATAPSTTWFLAEGATGTYFTTFVLVANPNDEPVDVTLTYLPVTGVPVTKTYTIAGGQRLTRNLAFEDPALANAAVATRVESTRPVVVERAQYWGQPDWIESHGSVGVTAAAPRWGLAEGRVGGANAAQTYILIANNDTEAATVTITFLRAGGTPVVKTYTVKPTSRFNVAVVPDPGSMVPELIDESFGARIESTRPIVVERSVYSNANGVTWAAGTNATATRLP